MCRTALSGGKELSLMAELQPEEIKDLLKELEKEDLTQEALPQEVEEVLQTLQSSSDSSVRREAAAQLGRVGTSSHRIVKALIAVCGSDVQPEVNAAAAKALRTPVHQEYMQQYPDLLEATEGVLQELHVLQRSRDERRRRPKKRRRRPKTTTEQAAIQRERQRGEQREAQREIQRAIEAREVHSRKVSRIVESQILVLIAVGIVWVSVVGIASAQSTTDFICFAFGALPGVALVAWGLLRWRAATVHRKVLLRSMTETVGTVEDLWNEEHKGEYEYETSYTYYVTVSFEAEDAKMGTRVMVLKTEVARDVWKCMVEGRSVGIRYAAEDPSIALIEGEW
jgi:hypothetical protein